MKLRLWLVVAAVLALQLAWLPALRPLGIVPNAALVLVVLIGLRGTASAALGVAVVAGLMLDLASGADFGLRLAMLVLAALVTGFVHRSGFTLGGPVVALVVVAAGTALANIAVLASLAQHGATHWPLGTIIGTLTLEIMLNLLLTLVLMPVVRWAAPSESELPGVE